MKKKILCIVLSVLLAITPLVFSACEKKGIDLSVESGAMTTKDLKNVYKSEIIKLTGTDFEKLDLSNVIKISDDTFVLNGYDTENYENKYFITDISFKEGTEIPLTKSDDRYSVYINGFTANPQDKSMFYTKNEYFYSYNYTYEEDSYDYDSGEEESVEDYYIVKVDAGGNIVFEKKINDYLMVKNSYDETEYMSNPSRLIYSNGKIVTLVGGQKICVFDAQTGEFVKEVTFPDGIYTYSLSLGKDGKIFTTAYGDVGMDLYSIDAEAGSVKKIETSLGSEFFYNYNISDGAAGYDIILSNQDGIYGFNLGDADVTELCNYINSDISANYSSPLFLNDGRILTTYYDEDDYHTQMLMLTKIDPSEMKERYVIKVAGVYLNYDLKNALMKFNREQDEYKVVFEDYSKYNNESNNWEGGSDELNRAIVSSDAPDMIFVDYSMNVESLASKGVFINIEDMMDSDEGFNKSDYLENVFEAMKIKGKLYTLTPSVNFMTIAGKKSIFGSQTGWTLSNFYNMHKGLGEGESMFQQATREDLGRTLVTITFDDFVDKNSGKCSFNSPEFKNLLEYLKDLPADYSAYSSQWEDNPNYWEEMELSYSKGTTKLYTVGLYNFNTIPEIEAYMGEEVTFVGYPTGIKAGNGTIINTNSEIAGLSSSKVKAGIWAVFKYLLGDAYQTKIAGGDNMDLSSSYRGYSYSFPIKKSIIEKKIENDLKPQTYTYTDEDGNEVTEEYGNTRYIAGTEVELRKSTRQDADRIYDLISNASVCYRSTDTKTDMILDEAKSYFNNQKSVDEVADVINSKMQIYINE